MSKFYACTFNVFYVSPLQYYFASELLIINYKVKVNLGPTSRQNLNLISQSFNHHSRRRMIWHPLSVSTSPLISPTFSPNAASSKGFCMSPRSKKPKSPPFWQLEHSEKLVASSLKSSGFPCSCLMKDWISNLASSLVRVTGLLRQESKGRRDSLCFCRMCAHLIGIQFKQYIFNALTCRSLECQIIKLRRSCTGFLFDRAQFHLSTFLRRKEGQNLGVTDLIHDQQSQETDRCSNDCHQSEIQPEGNLHKLILTWKWQLVAMTSQDTPFRTTGLFSYWEQMIASNPQRNMDRYSKGQQMPKTVSRGTKKPPTSRKGMMRTGTRAMTTPASEKTVERNKPNPELIQAQSSIESMDLKNTLALLSRLQGKQATAMKRKTVSIYTGCTAANLPKKQAEVLQVLLSLSRMKTGLSKLNKLTLAKTQLKPQFMMRKKRTPWLFWMISLMVLPFSQQRMMQIIPKKIAWKTFKMKSRGCLN